VELHLHPTNLRVHGVVVKRRVNLEFLNFKMNRDRLVLKGEGSALRRVRKIVKSDC